MTTQTCRWLFLVTAVIVGVQPVIAEDARIRIVFFTPQDVEPPANVPARMKQVVDYGQSFYGRWMQHWGYEPEHVLPVDRDGEGNPVIYYVRGSETAESGAYDKVGFQGQVREAAIAEHDIPRTGSTWWIFVYGTKLRASRGLGGHGDRKGNGLALLVWHDVAGELTDEVPLAGGIADRMNLKGYLHELGHTMSLPHIGPKESLGLGMSLMGPNARTYRRVLSNREERVYLTPAVAALIWKQPQMTGVYDPELKLPDVTLRGFRSTYDRREKRITLRGRLSSDMEAHSVVGIDIPEEGPGDYWKKAYTSRLEEDGSFVLQIDELRPSSGVVKVVFCFENGVFTGTGDGVGFRHALEAPYRFANGTYRVPRVRP